MPVVLNAVNETAVNAFLQRKIKFTDISRMVEKALKHHDKIEHPDLKTILAIDERYRNLAILKKL
jgi:1-deoxy-D-xylulose-5-phosphate reductoisomerase